MRVHYEDGKYYNGEKLLAEVVGITGGFGPKRPPTWSVIWSHVLQPGESFDVEPLPPPPYNSWAVQFRTTDGSVFADPGTIVLRSVTPKISNVVTVATNGGIVVSDS